MVSSNRTWNETGRGEGGSPVSPLPGGLETAAFAPDSSKPSVTTTHQERASQYAGSLAGLRHVVGEERKPIGRPPSDEVLRFWEKVDRSGDCWIWTAGVVHDGYGSFQWLGRNWRAHRIAFEWCIGPVGVGLVLDHLCRNRRCVRPDHLEPVSNETNILRGSGAAARNATKAYCAQGHPLFGANLGWRKGARDRKWRYCKECNNHRDQRSAPVNPSDVPTATTPESEPRSTVTNRLASNGGVSGETSGQEEGR